MKKGMLAQNGKPRLGLPFLFLALGLLMNKATVFSQVKTESLMLPPSPVFNQKRFTGVVAGEAAFSTLVAAGLNYLWYKKFPRSGFHFINDNSEWLNMDKAGHATTAYNIAAVQYDAMRWSGVDKRRANVIAGLTGLGFLTIIEIFDGFSEKWGFSKGDMLANLAGSGLFVLQQSLWQEQRVQLRFSYHNSPFAKYNPQELGRTLPQRLLKDYNGQTYWLSFNLSSFLPNANLPRWLNADLGYGAAGMIAGRNNPAEIDGKTIPLFERHRQLYFGLSGAAKKSGGETIPFPGWINILRMPAPASQWNLDTWKVHFKPLYF